MSNDLKDMNMGEQDMDNMSDSENYNILEGDNDLSISKDILTTTMKLSNNQVDKNIVNNKQNTINSTNKGNKSDVKKPSVSNNDRYPLKKTEKLKKVNSDDEEQNYGIGDAIDEIEEDIN